MLLTAVVFGLLSSLHCIGMCGPIAMMLPVDRQSTWKRLWQTLLYHLGRLCAYGMIGWFFGFMGKLVSLGGLQQRLSIVCGILMVVMAVIPERKWAGKLGGPVFRWVSSLKNEIGFQFKSRRPRVYFSIGFLNGLLPCGLVYAALFGALAMQSAPLGILFMVFFGLGTVPLMSFIPMTQHLFTPGLRSKMGAIFPIVVAIMGVLFILRGFGLGIPFLSPDGLDLVVGRGSACH